MSKELFDRIGKKMADEHQTLSGQMFGKPCIKTSGKKAFAAFFKDEMVFKLGKEDVEPLLEKYKGSQKWDPSGKNRPMKDWLQVPVEFKDEWKQLAIKAFEWVNE